MCCLQLLARQRQLRISPPFPADLRFYFVNAPGDASYPITGFSWVIVYQNQTNTDKGMAIANMAWWVIHDGQQYAAALSYVPLPQNIVAKGAAQIKSHEVR